MLRHRVPLSLVLLLSACLSARAAEPGSPLNLVESGRLTSWATPDTKEATELKSLADWPANDPCLGVVWNEERDVREIRARFAGAKEVANVKVQYWHGEWPPKAPAMPTIEDPNDDLWQGNWVDAPIQCMFTGGANVITFKPIEMRETRNASRLPGLTYRRTLKMRLVLPEGSPKLESLEMASDTVVKPLAVRIEFGCGQKGAAEWSGHLEIFNGTLLSAKPWNFAGNDHFEAPFAWKNVTTSSPKGVVVDLMSALPAPAGSYDMTVVTVRGTATTAEGTSPRTFSFNTLDLDHGPIYVPDLNVFVTKAEDPRHFAADYPARGQTIRDRIPQEPEQTFERATREIPPLDPWDRSGGGRAYMPVAADSSWQKFAVEYGGDIYINKKATKAKGAELKRLQWEGDTIRFRVGTMRMGAASQPYYREDRQAHASVAEECLPIVKNRWTQDGLTYEQESFATLLRGPLDPNDPQRSEQTPSVLLMQLKVSNPGKETARAACVLSVQPTETLTLVNHRVYGQSDARRLRMALLPPAQAETALSKDGNITSQFDVPAGGSKTFLVRIPFVSDLGDEDAAQLESLDYAAQRDRVAAYWREIVAKTTCFTTPEPEFNFLARSVVPHIHLSVTKDPKTGLYMVPAGSYGYDVYANESCFQALMLDALGDTGRGARYLDALLKLQGSMPPVGMYMEPHDGLFYGARVDNDYNYTATPYGLHHGTVLWALGRHYFYSRDADWLRATLPNMQRAVAWIERQRATTKKTDIYGRPVLEYGLMPVGRLEDNRDWGYWFSINAYCVAGMSEMAAALKDIQHPDAEKLQQQAEAYRNDLRTAVVRAIELAPVTRMRDGTYSPYVPTRAYQRFRNFGPLRVQYYSRYNLPDVLPCFRLSATREVLYGPMILLNIHIFGPHEPIANWILDDWEDNLTLSSSGGFNVHGFTDDKYWLSQGGMVFQANLQNPILVYLYRNEAPAAIRGVYNGLVACLYPEVHALTEEYRQWIHGSGPFYKSPDEARLVTRIRDMLVLESGDDLMLASGAPRRWFTSKEGIQVDRINSPFGPVGFSIQRGEDSKTLVAKVDPPKRNPPKRLWLYVRLPAQLRIDSVEIDGQSWPKIDHARERIELPQTDKPMKLTISYGLSEK